MIDDRLKNIAEYYGATHQRQKCIEEAIELALAIMQYIDGKATIYDIATEIADVQIMTEQMIFFFGINKQVEEQREFKINRQLERIKNEQRNNNWKPNKRPRSKKD